MSCKLGITRSYLYLLLYLNSIFVSVSYLDIFVFLFSFWIIFSLWVSFYCLLVYLAIFYFHFLNFIPFVLCLSSSLSVCLSFLIFHFSSFLEFPFFVGQSVRLFFHVFLCFVFSFDFLFA